MTAKPFSEAALCAAFIAAATIKPKRTDHAQWVAYPETGGFDILLVRQTDGVQIGIEAKLALNPLVVSQALPKRQEWTAGLVGPDYRAVLVPADKVQNSLPEICEALGVTVIRMYADPPGEERRYGPAFGPSLPHESFWGSDARNWFEWAPLSRIKLPDYIPDVVAGASAPIALTAWKVKAIRLSALLDEGPVTRADFKHLQLAPTNWLSPGGWLERTPAGWVRGPKTPDFKAQHPRNYGEIAADRERWAPKVQGLLATPSSLTTAE